MKYIPKKRITIVGPQEVIDLLQSLLVKLDKIERDREKFLVIHLNSRNALKLIEQVSEGSINASIVHPRETFRRAIIEASSSILIAHNHPSGDVEPSDADISVTKRLRDVGTLIGIEVVDSLIYTDKSKDYYSFREKGLLF